MKSLYDYAQGIGNGAVPPGRRISSFAFVPHWSKRPWPPRDKFAPTTDAALGLVVNCGSSKGITIGNLAVRILSLMGLESTHHVVSDPERKRPDRSEVFELICDNGLAARLMGWRPRVTLDDGLRQVIEHVGRHRDSYKPDIYNV